MNVTGTREGGEEARQRRFVFSLCDLLRGSPARDEGVTAFAWVYTWQCGTGLGGVSGVRLGTALTWAAQRFPAGGDVAANTPRVRGPLLPHHMEGGRGLNALPGRGRGSPPEFI